MNTFKLTILVAAAASALMAGSCGEKPSGAENGAEAAAASGEYERGPHRGRMLRDGPFAIEMTIFEDGVDPEFHVYAYENDKPLPPTEVQLGVELMRLGNRIDRFAFAPREDYLLGNGAVTEPHSFQVKVTATRGGKTYEWNYDSFEGRTTIARDQADAAGVKVEPAGPAAIDEIVALTGRVELQPEGRAEVRAWYPGRIVSMTRSIGDRVEKGQTLATVMSSESLQTYAIPAPISGVIMERNATPGDVAGAAPLYVIADPRKLHAEFFIYPRDAERLRAGQPVTVTSVGGASTLKAKIEVILPTSDLLTQTVVAHVELPNPDGVTWRPGQAVEGSVVVASDDVPLAVRTRALQRFRDFTVVYARVDDTYEVRMLELGRQSPEWTEVLGGDVEKTGASHDH